MSATGQTQRIHAIDYLRGLFATSILVYHFSTWAGYNGPGVSVLHKLGIYAVYAFYVISGISFGYIYRRLELRWADVYRFALKRFFRLWPLYTLACIASLLLTLHNPPPLFWIILNLTLTFGFINPVAYLPDGGWSIGNEMVFYLLFPFAIYALRKKRWAFFLFLLASIGVACWFAFVRLDPNQTLGSQWPQYVRPENHLFLFLSGVLVASWIGSVSFRPVASYLILLAAVGLFVALPFDGGEISLVTGWHRLVYGAICLVLCGVGALGKWPLPRIADNALEWLGLTSYSIYLLHPIVFQVCAHVVRAPKTAAAIAVPLTFVTVHFVYRWIEAPMIRLGKSIADGGRVTSIGGQRTAPSLSTGD
ncbi:MAG TPA: acyltransferase [Gemmatimonadaceae bacterium]|nr:acyltransferase [Gemmatimonadaceae bacterium]